MENKQDTPAFVSNKNYYAVIMAGGVGSRFWPVSTEQFPKQFHDLLGAGSSLLQKTYARLKKIVPLQNIIILTHKNYLQLTLQQLPEVNNSQVILEPTMRNTAPCLLLSALKIYKENPKAQIIVAPSDHWIEDEMAFKSDVLQCFEATTTQDILITLGIKPTFPNTGYGYIEASSKLLGNNSASLFKVNQFREKPDYETAKQFIAAGNFMWNAGIFIWSAAAIIEAFKTYATALYTLFIKGLPQLNTSLEDNFILEHYPKAENISIDYAILEKANNVGVKMATFDWNDLGTWGSLHEKINKDENNNAVITNDYYLNNAQNNIVYSASNKLVVIDGISNFIVVENDKVLMIYPKDKEQEIKGLVQTLIIKFPNQFN